MKFQNDSNVLTLQQAAYEAKAFETATMNRYLDGKASEQEHCDAMDATEMACVSAIKAGATYKDLPAH